MQPLTITLIATGGTIAKTYHNNGIANQSLMIDQMIAKLRLPDLTFRLVDLLRIDSLDMTDAHREKITQESLYASNLGHAVVITHGTDTMAETGRVIYDAYRQQSSAMPHPVVLTGAMLPYVMEGSDALQNLTEAFLATRVMPAGVYVALHNTILPLPHVRKNHQRGTFESTQD